MKRALVIAIIMATGACYALTGCYRDVRLPASLTSDNSSSGSDSTEVPADSVTFARYVIPIFTNNCTTCHGGNEAPDLRSAQAYSALINGGYVKAGDPTNSILYQKVSSGEMPPGGGLKQSDINLIKNWIANGALNN